MAQSPLDALRKSQIGTSSSWNPLDYGLATEMPAWPDLPPVPALFQPAGVPPTEMPSEVARSPEAPGVIAGSPLSPSNPSAHWTSPEERTALGATRQGANYLPAFLGLHTSAGPQMAPAPQGDGIPHRNQALVEHYARKLGLDPAAIGGSMSQEDLRTAEEQASAFPNFIERLKAMAPMSQEQMRASGNLAVAHEQGATQRAIEAAKEAQEQRRYEEFKQLALKPGGIPPGGSATYGNYSIKGTPIPSGPAAVKLAGDLKTAEDALMEMEAPGYHYDPSEIPFANLWGVGATPEQKKAALRARIANIYRQMAGEAPIPPPPTPLGGAVPQQGQAPVSPTPTYQDPPPGTKPGGAWITLPSGRRVYQEPYE